MPMGTPIRTFVDGVDYSNISRVQDGAGSFIVLTRGNSKTNQNVSDTPDIQEGPNLGDPVTYAAGDFTSLTGVFIQVQAWTPAGTVTTDLTLGSADSTPQPIKIQSLVTQPAAGGNQFLLLCNPTASVVTLGDYYLERDDPGTYHGPRFDLMGNVPAAAKVRVNLSSTSWLVVGGDALKLVYRNPGGANAPAQGADIVIDRVEYNATRNGALTWEPANTILGDAVAPGPGQILQRDSACTDTNNPADFTLATEPGLPSTNGPPSLSILSPSSGQAVQAGTTVAFEWTLSDDVFAPKYLHVWANLTVGGQTIPLVSDGLGTIKTTWTAPDAALSDLVIRVEAADPFGQLGGASQTFSVTRQSPLALAIAILIAVVLFAFILFGLWRARKKEQGPPLAPPPPPAPPAAPLTAPAAGEIGPRALGRKICPRCHTPVKVEDVTCFFCGYKFPEQTRPPP
jgi:hypothetical protein